jgi:general secretion pathway protein A
MYLSFYNLKKEPFNITPDPELLFLSPSHKEALAAVVYGVRQRKGFIAITGEVGVGKTTVIRSFLEKINRQTLKTIYLFNANISFKALLKTIFQGLGCPAPTDDVFEMVNQLHRLLIDEYKAGNNVVLVIDEAQNMPVETLENLRMLSNLETATDKLIQVVFSGQPEFEEKLNTTTLRQLRQRIVIRVRILPLKPAESRAYIDYRLAKTAVKDPDIFSKGAVQRIVKQADGIPRVINTLCDNCLITAFGRQQKKVSAKIAREIIADLEGARPVAFHWGIAVATVVVLATGVLLTTLHNAPRETARPSSPSVPAPVVSQPLPPQEVQAVPAPASPVPAVTATPQPDAEMPVRKVVKKGDTLARLILETYGSSDKRLIEMVKRNNPKIVNENIIVEGEKIYFPTKND